jgi:hypothetical protein
MLIEARAGDPQLSEEDHAAAVFLAGQYSTAILPVYVLPPIGTCAAMTGEYRPGDTFAPLLGLGFEAPPGGSVDAGEIGISSPSGSRTLTAWTPGFYSQPLSGGRGSRPGPPYLVPGEYRISGSGTPNVGPFSLRLRAAAPLVWNNRDRLGEIARSRGDTVEWSGAMPDRPVVVLAAGVDRSSAAAFACWCAADPEAGRFTIPPAILANLPAAEAEAGLPLGFLVVMQAGSSAAIEARGIDKGTAVYLAGSGRSVRYR